MNLLPKKGTYYKANLHCHTTISDGKLTPEQIKKSHLDAGYSIVAYTDHDSYRNHEELNDDNFLAIAALETEVNEIESPTFAKVRTYHFNFFDTNPKSHYEEKKNLCLPEERYHDMDYLNKYIEEMRSLGFLCCYNHPYWSLQNYDDYKNLKGVWGMEIYNHGCEVEGLYGYNPQSYDEMLRSSGALYCVATDDNHNQLPFGHPLCDSFGGFTMICAEEFTYDSIMKSLLQGEFYSSMGPEIYEFSLSEKLLKIKTSPVDKIVVTSEGRKCYIKAAEQGETIIEAEFEITGKEGYLRLTIKDNSGLFANTNAYFL